MASVPYHTHTFQVPTADESASREGSSSSLTMTPIGVKQSIDSEIGVTIASAEQGNKADSADIGYQDKDEAVAANIPISVETVDIKSYSSDAIDVGGALYRVASSVLSPDEYDSFPSALKFTSANGRKFVFKGRTIDLAQAGGRPFDKEFDNGVPMQAAFNLAQYLVKGGTSGVLVTVGPGEWWFKTKATCVIAASGVPSTGMVGISVKGAGDGITNLIAHSTNTDGVLRLSADRNTELALVSDLSILSDLDEDAAANNGIALRIDSTLAPGTAGFGDHPRWSVQLTNITIGGYGLTAGNLARRGNFLKGIYVENKWYPRLENIRVLGRYSRNVTRTAWTHGIHLHACYSPDLQTIYTHGGMQYGVWLTDVYDRDGGVEDFRYRNIFSVGQENGFGMIHEYSTVDPGRLYEPGGNISGLHVNSDKFGVTIRGHRQISITDFYGYAPSAAGAGSEALPSIILLDGAADILIDGQFLEPGFFVSNTNASVGVRLENGCEAISIKGQFGHGGIGVLNNSTYTTRQSIIVQPDIVTSRRTGAWAALTPLVDNANTATYKANEMGTGQDFFVHKNRKTSASYPIAMRVGSDLIGSAFAGAYEIQQVNSAGTVNLPLIIRAHLSTNTAGSEASIADFFVRGAGATKQAFRLQSTTTDGETYGSLLTRIGGVDVQKRVLVGAADSGGTGFRMLRITN